MGAYVNLKNRASQNRAQNRADETHLSLSQMYSNSNEMAME